MVLLRCRTRTSFVGRHRAFTFSAAVVPSKYRGPSFNWNGYSIKQGQTYNTGSSVIRTFAHGNVAFIQLDGNDLSAEIANNNGYTAGQQTNPLFNNEVVTGQSAGPT